MTLVLVTGADGFIGSHLVERLLRDGYGVRALVHYNALGSWGWLEHCPQDLRERLEVVSGDIRDHQYVRSIMEGREAVLHLAALIAIPYSYRAAQSYVDTNVTGTLNVMQAARECGTRRVIHTSTSEVYGTAQFVPITEAHPLNAQSPYAATKIAADQMALSYHRSFDVSVIVLRPFNTYGPRQSMRAVIPTVIVQLLEGGSRIRLGALHPTRDFNYVADTVSGFVAALEADLEPLVGNVINLGSGFEVSIRQTAEMIAEITGCTPDIECEEQRLRPEKSEVDRLWCDSGKARRLLGWTPAHGGLEGFRRGLEKTVEWFANPSNRASYKAGIYGI